MRSFEILVQRYEDYAFNLAVIRELITRRLYDKAFAEKYIEGFKELEQFVSPYTPEWAEAETGIPASQLKSFVEELAAAAPSVIWHPGWMAARYKNSFLHGGISPEEMIVPVVRLTPRPL